MDLNSLVLTAVRGPPNVEEGSSPLTHAKQRLRQRTLELACSDAMEATETLAQATVVYCNCISWPAALKHTMASKVTKIGSLLLLTSPLPLAVHSQLHHAPNCCTLKMHCMGNLALTYVWFAQHNYCW